MRRASWFLVLLLACAAASLHDRLPHRTRDGVMGFDWQPRRRFSPGTDYQISRPHATYALGTGLGNAADLPQTFYRLSTVTVDARWKRVERTTLVARFAWEEYDVADWAVQGLPLVFPVIAGNATNIFLGDNSQNYVAQRMALLVSHRF